MRFHKKTSATPFGYFGVCALTMAMVACGGGGDTAGTAEAQSVESDTATKQALGVPSGWVGRKPPADTAKKIKELEASGALPKLDASNSVAGPDLDKNGIRDDIDNYIDSQSHYTPKQKIAVQGMARAIQSLVVANTTSELAIEAMKINFMKNNACVKASFISQSGFQSDWRSGFQAASAEIKKLRNITTNTKPRLLAYLSFMEALNGTTISSEKCE